MAGKPIGINQHIGQHPIAAFGISDGDIGMLQYTDSGKRAHLEMLVLHDDAEREYAYTCNTELGRLCKGLDSNGNTLVYPRRGDVLVPYPEKDDWSDRCGPHQSLNSATAVRRA